MSSPITIELEPKSISSSEPPEELKFLGHTLQHQVDVFEKSRDHDIIMDLAPTGTGKTKAGLSVLLHNRDRSGIYIAPTNALVEQQTEAAKQFVKDAGLNHFVIAASAKEVRAWSNDRVGSRPGEKIYNLLRNPAIFFPELGEYRPILLVTNPNLFYYATFFAYNRLDRVNIASTFYNQFATVIFDEFHLYDSKQLVSLFFYLAFSQVFGFFENNRKVVLLTATPDKTCEAALSELKAQGVKIARVDGEAITDRMIPSQTSVRLEIKSQSDRDSLLESIANEVKQRFENYPDRNGAIILDSKDHINRLADLLHTKGLGNHIGRITGSTPKGDRKLAAQQPIILATSTVDVGFNFERSPDPARQNLDWLIFTARDRAAFWQRIGRVGRVLGKRETNISSEAIAYLPETAWEQGITDLNCDGGRSALCQKLEELKCLDKPFLEIYWQSEAFLEIAKPLLVLSDMMEKLPQADFIPKLYETLKVTLGGRKDWNYYKRRMRALQGAESLSRSKPEELKGDPLKFLGQAKYDFVNAFLKAKYPEEAEELRAKRTSLSDYEKHFKEDREATAELKDFAVCLSASYSPLFQFRENLFENLGISDPKGLILDYSEETELDPIHLLRHYEFTARGTEIEITKRANPPYTISFSWRYHGSKQDFLNTQINKLTVLKGCNIQRMLDGAIFPTPLLKSLEKELLSGVIICPIASASAYFTLRKMRITAYPITIRGDDFEKEYSFLPALSGILTAAMAGVKIRLMDEENFWIA
ncbi:MAG: type I-D CRISPR-associated helicase Cas3' [Pseudanabaenaceae cyanobacterium bins.39]|nr:type I-D CRISPR-associated helicase Cas3' [Pseudanabaenaceae cyanobacterium bins.39]